MKSIEEIIDGCRRNKTSMQALLFQMFSDKMYGVCLYYSGSSDEAEDLLHDGFMKVFENIKNYQSTGNFEGWMRRIFVNEALMYYRRSKKTVVRDNFEEIIEDIHDADQEKQLDNETMMRLISELPPQYRLVFNLHAIEGHKHKEIAEMLEITEGTSKSNLARARVILQKHLMD